MRVSQPLATSAQSIAFRGGGHTLGTDGVDSAYVPDTDAPGSHLILLLHDSLDTMQTMGNKKWRAATLPFDATDSASKGADFTTVQNRKTRCCLRRSTRDGSRCRCRTSKQDSPSKWSCRRGLTRTTCSKDVRFGDLGTGLGRLSQLP